jgi:transcriptional regulator with XRE-family HTH domain
VEPLSSEEILRELREWCQSGYGRQIQLAEALGVSAQRVSHWLRGRRKLTLELGLKIHAFLECKKGQRSKGYHHPVEEIPGAVEEESRQNQTSKENKINTQKEQAEKIAKERNVYDTVQTVAKTGRSRGLDYTQHVELEDRGILSVEITAVTGQASVHHSKHGFIYKAYREGESLDRFRPGRWLDTLEKMAKDIKAKEAERQAEMQEKRKDEESVRFEPLD